MKKIRHIFGGVKYLFVIAFTFMLFPFARIFLWHKKIWLISESGYDARDNGYSFFKYMRETNKHINCYYAISKKAPDYDRVKIYGNIIEFGSFKHYVYFCAARYNISSKTPGFYPSYYIALLRKHMHLWGKYIFLQHGITKDDQKFLYKKSSKIDLFICGAKPEYDDIKARYGYNESEVVYTGFSRFDDYYNLTPKNQILVMPTWRRYTENKKFVETSYFKAWFSFLNSQELNNLLLSKKIVLYFYLHPHFKEQYSLFSSKCKNITILPFDNTDLQKIIRESKMFITDFSSLAFDFGYMRRPVLYYQYDEMDYFKGHYIKGYFDYRRDGFGHVCENLKNVICALSNIINSNFRLDDYYLNNCNMFFPLCDRLNSERIFVQIKKIRKEK